MGRKVAFQRERTERTLGLRGGGGCPGGCGGDITRARRGQEGGWGAARGVGGVGLQAFFWERAHSVPHPSKATRGPSRPPACLGVGSAARKTAPHNTTGSPAAAAAGRAAAMVSTTLAIVRGETVDWGRALPAPRAATFRPRPIHVLPGPTPPHPTRPSPTQRFVLPSLAIWTALFAAAGVHTLRRRSLRVRGWRLQRGVLVVTGAYLVQAREGWEMVGWGGRAPGRTGARASARPRLRAHARPQTALLLVSSLRPESAALNYASILAEDVAESGFIVRQCDGRGGWVAGAALARCYRAPVPPRPAPTRPLPVPRPCSCSSRRATA